MENTNNQSKKSSKNKKKNNETQIEESNSVELISIHNKDIFSLSTSTSLSSQDLSAIPPVSNKTSSARIPTTTPTSHSSTFAYRQAMKEFYQTADPNYTNDDGYRNNHWVNYFSNNTDVNLKLRTTSQRTSGNAMATSSPRRKHEEDADEHLMNVSSPDYSSTMADSCSVFSTVAHSSPQEENADLQENPYPPINEPQMPDATYEETYGDAYVGGPIKYIYPSGYQNMRPRGSPWKLSLVVFALFTWMSVFIVDHCSDQVDLTNQYYEVDGNIDDDTIRIATGWCGSRMLYFMWLVSVIITALAAAYCSIIGYIKLRDFAVANSRSQPPGIMGRSDYYVRIEENNTYNQHHDKDHSLQIYQSDGTPQFWGGHIHRPTQAAVAVTSR